MGRLPPSSCKVYGSANHWDKECPDWAIYKAKQLKSAYRIKVEEDQDLESYYSSIYSVLVTKQLALENGQLKESEQLDFETAVLENASNFHSQERKTSEPETPWRQKTVLLEEVADKFWEEFGALKKSAKHLLYREGDEDDDILEKEVLAAHKEDGPSPVARSDIRHARFKQSDSVQDDTALPSESLKEAMDPPQSPSSLLPPSKECHFRIPKR